MARKKTNNEFIKEIYELVENEYQFLEYYDGALTLISCKHNKCGYVWKITPSSFLCGRRCPQCAGNAKKTQRQFEQEVCKLVENEYIFLDAYKNAKTKIRCKHNICGHVWEISPTNFLDNNRRCPKCAGNIKKTVRGYKREIYKLVGSEYEVLGEYTNSTTKIKFRHNICGHEWYANPRNIINGSRCPVCQHRSYRKTMEEFEEEVLGLVGNEYIFLEKYTTNQTKIKCQHKKCGHTWSITPLHFLNGVRCPECSRNKLKTNEEFTREVYNLVGDEYVFLEEYINARTEIKCKHETCGHIWNTTPNKFLTGTRCPCCIVKSKGEDSVKRYLESENINFMPQYRFDDCRNSNPLPFDFAVLDSKGTPIMLIEYDGEQHYKPVNFGGVSEEEAEGIFEDTKYNDNIKNQYCKDNGIPLLRIPYWNANDIEKILPKKLHMYISH